METDNQLSLLPYQQASVKMICDHFLERNRALLADEVGLGKTFVAQGVLREMAERHKKEHKGSPFRVAYICPNQNVAAQNSPKLAKACGAGWKISEEAADRLQDALDSYILTLGEDKQKTLQDNCVYTRLCRWLIKMGKTGCGIREAMSPQERYLYLPGSEKPEKKLSKPTECSHHNDHKGTKYLQLAAKGLLETMIKCAPEWLKRLKTLCGLDNPPSPDTKLPKKFYSFNQAAACRLAGITTEDYRLSMQHLYSAETGSGSGEEIQFEALTPGTSFKLYTRSGTYKERALLFATIECWLKQEKIQCDWFKKAQKNEKEKNSAFQDAFDSYKERLELLKLATIRLSNMIPEKVQESLHNNKPMEVPEIRKAFAKNNAETFLEYDLVILDEFQNFPELIGCGEKKDSAEASDDAMGDAETMARSIFQKGNCKVLLLSATPYSINDYIPEGFEEEADDSSSDKNKFFSDADERGRRTRDDVYQDFLRLLRFMGEGPDIEAQWKKRNRSNPEKCWEILHNAGIFRTERMSATRHAPIIRKLVSVIPSFSMRLKTNCLMSEQSGYRTSYGDSTPFPLVFGAGYKFSKDFIPEVNSLNLEEDWKKELFLTEEQLAGKTDSVQTGNARFQRLKKYFARVGASSMLWIPPCSHKEPLKGAFKGKDGYSKTLIFSHFRMTPLAITYLLCSEAARELGQNQYKELFPKEEIEKRIRSLLPEKTDYKRTLEELISYFVVLFSEAVGQAAVRKVYGDLSYPDAVEQYCKDGCFSDMLVEYVGLLKNEYGAKDAAMARAVREVALLRISRPKLNIWNGKAVESKQVKAANRFAVGLFPENDNGNDLIRRMRMIKNAFNSPFWPFVFTSTSIGAEGIDLHWYTRNVIHWSIPARPLDLEQREGRILRYRCHAFRLNAARSPALEDCLKPDWYGSGMFETQLNFSSDKECGSCFHIISWVLIEKGSRDEQLYEKALEIVGTYRKTLGTEQPPTAEHRRKFYKQYVNQYEGRNKDIDVPEYYDDHKSEFPGDNEYLKNRGKAEEQN